MAGIGVTDTAKSSRKWIPLESNPDVLNNYVARMGLNTALVQFTDVLSTEDWALAMVPQPCLAVILLFPIKPHIEEYRKEEARRIAENGQTCSKDVYFMKQYISNACGTVGVLHAMGNAAARMPDIIQADSFLAKFFNDTRGKAPDEIAQALEEADEVETFHGEAAADSANQTAIEEDVNTHFVALVEIDGHIYELDGRKESPINHGPCTADTLLARSAEIAKDFMARDPDEYRFTVMALAASAE